MKPEDLEPLLLDRALGELSPAVTELLEQHLARDPKAARQAATYTATLAFAREAVGLPTSTVSLRPLDHDRLRRAERRARWRSHLGEGAKLAACIALGLVLGRTILANEKSPPSPINPVLAAAPAVPAAGSKFWSVTNLEIEHRLQSARRERRKTNYKLQWESPLKMPRLEEQP